MPRSKTAKSLALIDACAGILEEIQPATVRAVCYQLFIRYLIDSMEVRHTKRVGLGHMTVDTCGKKFLLTLHTAFKAHRISAAVPRSSKESWCPNMAIRLAWFLAGRR